jgi:ribosomal protein S6--L-glutamate ligase
MILSLHPLFKGDRNLNPAGRPPTDADENLMRQASAVILPQGCSEPWYTLARRHKQHVFPNYDARWRFPGKIGQIRMFQRYGWRHPRSLVFPNSDTYRLIGPPAEDPKQLGLPLVFKFDWGGEGDTVYLIENQAQLDARLQQAQRYENTGQSGFLLQEFIPDQRRSLRVVVIGSYRLIYWRVGPRADTFLHSVAGGALCDFDADIDLQRKALKVTETICECTGINLAGLDFLFDPTDPGNLDPEPLLLEINYFFGRRGIGGSKRFYRILRLEIHQWLRSINLKEKIG